MEIARLGPLRSRTRLTPTARARARGEPYRPVEEVARVEPSAAADPIPPLASGVFTTLIEAQERHGADDPPASSPKALSRTLISQTIERK